jgi:hypothetical protein
LETWREWFGLLDGTLRFPGIGHDPTPWVETTAEGFVVWSDGGLMDSTRTKLLLTFTPINSAGPFAV